MRHERVEGPYAHGRRWRCRLTARDGTRGYRSFATRELAERFVEVFRAEAERSRGTSTVYAAVDAYEKHLIAKGNRPTSWKETPRRLRRFFPDGELALLTKASCEKRYAELVAEGLAADTHRNYLLEARSFLRWCIERGWLQANPLDGVQGVGARTHGKPQPRLDEARLWKAKALELAWKGDYGAIAALMAMMLGMRSSEITMRRVRDLDDDGRILHVERAKTRKGNRVIQLPLEIRPLLRWQAEQRTGLRGQPRRRDGEEWLFPAPTHAGGHYDKDWVRDHVRRICALVRIPMYSAQAMRGLVASLGGMARSGLLEDVAQLLGHEETSTTATSYADRDRVEAARRAAGLEVLDGGRAAPHSAPHVRRDRRK